MFPSPNPGQVENELIGIEYFAKTVQQNGIQDDNLEVMVLLSMSLENSDAIYKMHTLPTEGDTRKEVVLY